MKFTFTFSKFWVVGRSPLTYRDLESLADLCLGTYRALLYQEVTRRVFIPFILFPVEVTEENEEGEEETKIEVKRIFIRDFLDFMYDNFIVRDAITYFEVTFKEKFYKDILVEDLLWVFEYGSTIVYPYRIMSKVINKLSDFFNEYLEGIGWVSNYEFGTV